MNLSLNKENLYIMENKDIIHFNVPPFIPKAFDYMRDAVESHKISGDGKYTKLCDQWMEEKFGCSKVLLTTSGSSALDMAALLCDIKEGDEVILPSFTFSSTANAFALRGAKLVFVDIRPDTMNIDETKIESAITDKTKVIVPVHYAGVACEMDTIMQIAYKHNLKVVEDAAQAIMSTYKGKALGTIGDFGCFSFHETKNFSMGEGGALLINNENYIDRAEILWEKGTNRRQFFRGQISKYNWVDLGDSFLQSDINAAYLWAQLEVADKITSNRLTTWNQYRKEFIKYAEKKIVTIPTVPEGCVHNAHLFYIKLPDVETRQKYIDFMKDNKILVVFHYIPLHSAPAGLRFGRFNRIDEYTTCESNRLVRLPLYYNIDQADLNKIISKSKEFFSKLE